VGPHACAVDVYAREGDGEPEALFDTMIRAQIDMVRRMNAMRRNEPTADLPVNAHRDRDLGNEHSATAIGNTDGQRAKEMYNCSTTCTLACPV
jgi:hypothetical protein